MRNAYYRGVGGGGGDGGGLCAPYYRLSPRARVVAVCAVLFVVVYLSVSYSTVKEEVQVQNTPTEDNHLHRTTNAGVGGVGAHTGGGGGDPTTTPHPQTDNSKNNKDNTGFDKNPYASGDGEKGEVEDDDDESPMGYDEIADADIGKQPTDDVNTSAPTTSTRAPVVYTHKGNTPTTTPTTDPSPTTISTPLFDSSDPKTWGVPTDTPTEGGSVGSGGESVDVSGGGGGGVEDDERAADEEFCAAVHAHVSSTAPRHKMSICTMIKDEARFIEEWLEYHLLQRVDHFYIYNDGSSDNIQEVLQPYIAQGIVSLFSWNKNITVDEKLVELDPKYTRNQRFALADCVYHHQQETEWLGIWDVDEFIYVTEKYTDFQDFIERYLNAKKRDYFQIPLTIMGPSDHNERPAGLVIQNYHWRTSKTMYGYNPKTDKFVGKAMYRSGCAQPVVHVAPSLPPQCEPTREWVDFDHEPDYAVHMKHYYSKSYEDYKEKLGKWKFDTSYENFVTSMKGMHDIYDTDMNKHVKNVRRAIECTRRARV